MTTTWLNSNCDSLKLRTRTARSPWEELANIDRVVAAERERFEGRSRLARAQQDAARTEGTLAELALGPQLQAAMDLLENAELERDVAAESLETAKENLDTAMGNLEIARESLAAREQELVPARSRPAA